MYSYSSGWTHSAIQVASKVMRAPSPVTLGNLRLNVAVLMTATWR